MAPPTPATRAQSSSPSTRHGAFTDVTARTDRLRTSRMDYEIQRFLNHLPYEYGDAGGPGSGDPD